MDISSLAASATASTAGSLRQEVSFSVLKKAIDVQAQSALQLLEAVPAVTPSASAGASGTSGGVVDTWA